MLCSFQSTNGGDEEDRTPDPLRARQVLSQLSYTPMLFNFFQRSLFYQLSRFLSIEFFIKNSQN